MVAPESFTERTGEHAADAWSHFTDRAESLVDHLPVVGVALAIIIAFGLFSSLLRRIEAPYRLFARSPLLRAVIRNIIATAVLLAGVLAALELMDATKIVAAVLGAAGVFGLALGFAFKDIVENYLASVLLALRRPFSMNDLVRIGEHEGTVMTLTTRDTVLMTIDGNHLRVPNALVFKSVVVNYTRNPLRRFDFGVGAGTNEDLGVAQRLGVSTLEQMDSVVVDPAPFALIENLGDSTVTVHFFGWVDQREHDFLRVRSAAIRRVKEALDDADIELPEPTYRVALIEPPPARPKAQAEAPSGETDEPDTRRADTIERQIDADRGSDLGPNLLVDPES